MTEKHIQTEGRTGETPLQGWKEISSYLGRDTRTARRWEQQSALPVRRHGGPRASVYAYPSELDAWRAARKPRAAAARFWTRRVAALAGGLALLVRPAQRARLG